MKDRQKDHQRLLTNMRALQKMYTKAALCELLGISSATWTNRMRQPWRSFSYDDFKALSIYCKVDFMQLMEGALSIK